MKRRRREGRYLQLDDVVFEDRKKMSYGWWSCSGLYVAALLGCLNGSFVCVPTINLTGYAICSHSSE